MSLPPLTPLNAAVAAGALLVLLLVAVALGLAVALGRAGRRTDQLVAAVCDLAARLTEPADPARPSPRPQQHRRAVVRHDATRVDLHGIYNRTREG